MAARLALLSGQRIQYWLQDEFSEPLSEQAPVAAQAYATGGPTVARPAPEPPKAAPAQRPDLRDLLHALLRRYAQPAVGEHRPSASIDKIGITFVAYVEELARDSAASAAMAGLQEFARLKPGLLEQEQARGYRMLVTDIGAKLTLDADQARELVRLLGLSFVGGGNVVQLRNGELRILPLPVGSAQVELRVLTEQLGEPLAKTIAAIAQSGNARSAY